MRKLGIKNYRFIRLLTAAIGLAAAALLLLALPVQGGERVVLIDECWGVDHFPNVEDYPLADLSGAAGQQLLNSPSWILLGYTFNLEVVPMGSELTITFADGEAVMGTVGEYGKTFAYRGVFDYGIFQWSGALLDPDGLLITDTLKGAVQVGSGENLTCNPEDLIESMQPATSTPPPTLTNTPSPATATTAPTAEPELFDDGEAAVVVDEPEIAIADEGGFFGLGFGATEWVLLLCCCLLLLGVVTGVVVVVVVRRNKLKEAELGIDDEDFQLR